MFSIQVAGQQGRQSTPETGGQVCSYQWARGLKVSHKDFHRFVGQHNLNVSCPQVGQARNGHFVDYTTANQYGCTAPAVCLSVQWQT